MHNDRDKMFVDFPSPQPCVMCGGPAKLLDTVELFPICDSDCLERVWRQRVERDRKRLAFVQKTRRAWERQILAETAQLYAAQK